MPQEVRLGLALNGGVSLAIWIGGVADELLRAVSAGTRHPDAQPAWIELCRELDVSVKIDVIVGTSAGGVNGAFLASGLANDAGNLQALQNLWIDDGDFSQLLNPPRAKNVRSLLRGDTFFLPSIQRALEAVAASGRGPLRVDPPLDIRLTSTDLNGRLMSIPDGDSMLQSVDHAVEFKFTDEDFHFTDDPQAAHRVARACRSTASFPGAFEASPIPAGLFEPRHAPALAVDGVVAPTFLVDGGVLNNLPARNAVAAIAAQPARERVHRVLALVVPDPVMPVTVKAGEPLLGQTVGQSALSIPRKQSLSSFLTEVQAHNHDVLSRRAARTAFLGELGELGGPAAWARLSAIADSMFPPYRAARHRRACDQLVSRLAGHLDPDMAALLTRVAGDAEAVVLPWVPDALDDRPEDCWGGSPVHRLVSRLVTWTDLAAAILVGAGDHAAAHRLLRRKTELADIRESAECHAPVETVDALLLEEQARHPGQPQTALLAALDRWAAADDLQELNGQMGRLGDHLWDLAEALRPHVSKPFDEATRTLAGLVVLCDGAGREHLRSLLLSLEVVEMAFGPSVSPPDQVIRLANFTADARVAIDPAGRDDPEEKLAGVQLGHFAAFLKRSWRANDWMWGRLDASERLVRLLDESTGGRLAASGRLDHHLRAVQSAVLRDLLPVVAAEIDTDGAAGARVTPEARRFADAVHAAGRAEGGGPVTLRDVGEDELSELLGLNLVGVERLAGEVATPYASTLLLNAVTTMSGLLKEEAPGGVRSVVSLLSWTSTAIWRWRQLPRTIRRWSMASIGLLTLAALVLAVTADGHDGSLSTLVTPAWVVVVIGGMLAAGRVALFVLTRRNRRRGVPRVVPPDPLGAPDLDMPPIKERTTV